MTAKLVGIQIPDESVEDFRLHDIAFDAAEKHEEECLKKCDLCGKSFWRPTSEWVYQLTSSWYEIARGRKPKSSPSYFCSYTCYRKAEKIAESEKSRQNLYRVCKCCGKTFIAKMPDARYCGKQCYEIAYLQRKHDEYDAKQRATGIEVRRDEQGRRLLERKCVVCGKTFWNVSARAKLCSRECTNAWSRERHKQKNAGERSGATNDN